MGFIPAGKWDRMSNKDILQSLEIALRTLNERKLSKGELKYASILLRDFATLIDKNIENP